MSYSMGLKCGNEKKAYSVLNTILESKIFIGSSVLSDFHNYWNISNDGLPYIEEQNIVGFNSSRYIHSNNLSIVYSFFYILAIKMEAYTRINGKNYIVMNYDGEENIILGKINPNIDGYDFVLMDANNVAINYKKGWFSFIKHNKLKKEVVKIQNIVSSMKKVKDKHVD